MVLGRGLCLGIVLKSISAPYDLEGARTCLKSILSAIAIRKLEIISIGGMVIV